MAKSRYKLVQGTTVGKACGDRSSQARALHERQQLGLSSVRERRNDPATELGHW